VVLYERNKEEEEAQDDNVGELNGGRKEQPDERMNATNDTHADNGMRPSRYKAYATTKLLRLEQVRLKPLQQTEPGVVQGGA
jgi:hypothetical protein